MVSGVLKVRMPCGSDGDTKTLSVVHAIANIANMDIKIKRVIALMKTSPKIGGYGPSN